MNERWRGTFTALVTPFRADLSVDEERLGELVERQVEGKVAGLVPCGTTGEAATLTNEEHLRVVELVTERAAGRLPVLAGVGGNNTDNVILLARKTESLGAQGVLAVAPYYNKPTQEGMFQHFTKIADSIGIPLILYNVPGRTSSNILPATVLRLAEHDNIHGIKEASGSLPQVMEILAGRPAGFRLLSGEDNLTLAMLGLGADGVVSVASNEVPLLMSEMVRAARAGDLQAARAQHFRLLDLMNANFIETNPIPVKAALAMMGLIEEHYRLPLVPMEAQHREQLRGHLQGLGLIEG
ncbi:MAG: 4-hydroxy-tetrahydrodipicolinate synthase [Acidobacteriota bacterium]